MRYTFIPGLIFLAVTLLEAGTGLSPAQVMVRYTCENEQITVTGEKIGAHTYLFNRGGSKHLDITTLDWKPYVGETLCGQGWVQQLTIALLTSQGYEVQSTFLPWARTIAVAETGQSDILYPEYYIEPGAPSDVIEGTLRRDHLALSKRIPGGPIVFMKRKGEPDAYKGDLKNLKQEKIGVVRGYQNTPEFDALMDSGYFDISMAVDDFMNVKKLFSHRVNLIIGDPAVIFYNIQTAPVDPIAKTKMLDGIEVVTPMIQYNYLYYAVSKKRPEWEQTLADLNHAITRFEQTGMMLDIIRQTTQACGIHMDDTFLPYQAEEALE